MSKRKKIISIAGIALLAWIAGESWWRYHDRLLKIPPVSSIEFPNVGSAARDFTLPDIRNNKNVSLTDFRGKRAVFINIWASWSPFSRDEMRDLALIQNEFSTSVAVLAINRMEDRSVAKNYANNAGAGDTYALLLDSTDEIWKQYRGFTMPTSIFIDKTGIIREVKFGPLTLDEMKERVRRISNF